MNTRELVEITAQISYLDWILDIRYIDLEQHLIAMRWTFSDAEGLQECRRWLIDLETATHSDIVQTALRAAIDAQEHEVREQFRYKDKKIYGPHFDPDSLAEFARYKKNLSLKGMENCSDCDGKGITPGWPHTRCVTCKGVGWLENG